MRHGRRVGNYWTITPLDGGRAWRDRERGAPAFIEFIDAKFKFDADTHYSEPKVVEPKEKVQKVQWVVIAGKRLIAQPCGCRQFERRGVPEDV
jgi:hypothetical protein